ncbi:MAG: DNA alkylation repair protein [Candidatus Aminicenantes bacterium]|jgi:3-methyladenine DNA glycosylase AlkC
MAERLKDMFFTRSSMDAFADTIRQSYPEFDKKKFIEIIFDETFEGKEILDKMRHTTQCLNKTFPGSYKEALDILKQAAPHAKGFEALSLPDYVATYGLEDWDLSLDALYHFTKYSTSELAIRPFLAEDPDRVMALMVDWAEDRDPKVRRFASEGCRPRLPWAMALPKFKKDPSLILPVLEKLKNDESEDVRRSVANNLNDISKDNPEVTLKICEKWYGQSKDTDWIVKHACRTMLKAGDKRALSIFGYTDPSTMRIKNFKLEKTKLKIGDDMRFSFDLAVKEKSKVRLEYAIAYVKAKGKRSKKVFKITENDYPAGTVTVSRKHSLADMSTRKHYPGQHLIAIIVNGKEMDKASFELK